MPANEFEFVDDIRDMPDDVLLCKANRPHTMRITDLREGVWDEIDWRCEECGRTRSDSWDANGRLIEGSRSYGPLARSRVRGDMLEPSDYKKEMIRRLKEGGMQSALAKPKRQKRPNGANLKSVG